MAAQAVESHFDRAQAHPVASADDTAAARRHARCGGDRKTYRAADIDTIRPFVHVDQDRERMRGAGVAADRLRDRPN